MRGDFDLQQEAHLEALADSSLSLAAEDLGLHVVCSAANVLVINREEMQELWGGGLQVLFPTNVFVNMGDHMFVCRRGFTQRKEPKAQHTESPASINHPHMLWRLRWALLSFPFDSLGSFLTSLTICKALVRHIPGLQPSVILNPILVSCEATKTSAGPHVCSVIAFPTLKTLV